MNDIPQNLVQALRARQLVPLIGAGASITAGGPSWAEHLRQLARGLKENQRIIEDIQSGSRSFLEIASEIVRAREMQGLHRLRIFLPGPSPIHESLASWECPLYLTTNFDNGLEQAFSRNNRPVVSLANDQLDQLDLSNLDSTTIIVKLCSSTRFELGGALTKRDFYELIYATPAVNELLSIVFHSRLVVFVGCSMRDPLIEAALHRSSCSGLAGTRHIAFMADSISTTQTAELRDLRVDVHKLPVASFGVSLRRALDSIRAAKHGVWHLVIFEPGSVVKAQQVIRALSCLNAIELSDIARIAVVTENKEVITTFSAWGVRQSPAVPIVCIEVDDVADAEEISRQLMVYGSPWNAILAPYELTIEEARKLVSAYANLGFDVIARFFSDQAVSLSRRKDSFRQFLQEKFENHDIIRPLLFTVVKVGSEWDSETIFKLVNAFCEWHTPNLVIKPLNAAGSIGVRPIYLSSDVQKINDTMEGLHDLGRVLAGLPHERATRRCITDSLLVEERLVGEEYSVEARASGGNIEILAVHWNPDIDSNALRFFERVYVTLPPTVAPYEILSQATAELLSHFGSMYGVFHAEFRVNAEDGLVFPLEVGLRPGGGGVNDQVKASCGIDLFEAALRAALHMPQRPKQGSRIVAAAEVFANKPGVLPPIRVRDDTGKLWAVRKGDEHLLLEWLRKLLAKSQRTKARQLLANLLCRKTKICSTVLDAFDSSGFGIRAKLEMVDVWMEAGEAVTEQEACYVAGLRVVANEELQSTAAVAEALAAMELCYYSIVCDPEPDIRTALLT
jgi:hypothetical protein